MQPTGTMLRERTRRHYVQIKKRKNQFGGALAKKRGPSGVDKAGYWMSMFLSGPTPSFATAGGKLAVQAYKGVSDNWDRLRGKV